MTYMNELSKLKGRFLAEGDHAGSDYFGLINEIINKKQVNGAQWNSALTEIYQLLFEEISENKRDPVQPISFGTSGWRGTLGKDVFGRSVALVTQAIVNMYASIETDVEMASLLGVSSLSEACTKGCVLGFDNRFGGEFLACQVAKLLSENGFTVFYAGESTTGVLSAAVLIHSAAFSINLTPSHNPLEYSGYKFNGADGGPASDEVTKRITENARTLVAGGFEYKTTGGCASDTVLSMDKVQAIDSLGCWKQLVEINRDVHGLDITRSVKQLTSRQDIVLAVDCVHGASRLHIENLFNNNLNKKLILLRSEADVTFGGVAPEPSSVNMKGVVEVLTKRPEPLKVGAIIDPDGDRIRFTDGTIEISMNQFGAMAYHFLYSHKKRKGMVAKTVATSNLANSLARAFEEKLFEPRVGFKNFKPVIGEALVYFEESDGISIIGHTPEKDAYIGLLLALEMILTLNMNLGEYLKEIESEFGSYYPDRDGVVVNVKGEQLQSLLAGLEKYQKGGSVTVGGEVREIAEVITIDGQKIIFSDGSWLMIRPSGTEPKVRFYVESRSPEGTKDLVLAAQEMLKEIGLLA